LKLGVETTLSKVRFLTIKNSLAFRITICDPVFVFIAALGFGKVWGSLPFDCLLVCCKTAVLCLNHRQSVALGLKHIVKTLLLLRGADYF
jgi:hypothetical protein